MKQKTGKRTLSIVAIILGISLFTGAAFADLVLGSGYTQLKQSVKTTAEELVTLPNVTGRISASIALDGQVVEAHESIVFLALDQNLQMTYERSKQSDYSYSEQGLDYYSLVNFATQETLRWSEVPEGMVNHSASQNVYTLYQDGYSGYDAHILSENPFDYPIAADMEKVMDALVGNLSNLVMVSSHDEGKEFTGTLGEAQIPVLVQALSSYVFKEMSGAYLPEMEAQDYGTSYNPEAYNSGLLPFYDNIAIETVRGNAITDSADRIRVLTFDVTIGGTDRQGMKHSLELALEMNLDDIGTTLLQWPDISTMNVEIVHRDTTMDSQIMPAREVGRYVGDIILDTGDAYIKIGERQLEILEANAAYVQARYQEVYLPEYEELNPHKVGALDITTPNNLAYYNENPTDSPEPEYSALRYKEWGAFEALDSYGVTRSGMLDLWTGGSEMYIYFNNLPDFTMANGSNIFYTSLYRQFN